MKDLSWLESYSSVNMTHFEHFFLEFAEFAEFNYAPLCAKSAFLGCANPEPYFNLSIAPFLCVAIKNINFQINRHKR